jgi:transcription initiation factor TFIID subunit TAF12
MTDQTPKPENEKPTPTSTQATQVSTLNATLSVFRAWFGVQSEENRKRDFSTNDPTPFIVAGVVFTLVMIVGVIIAVKVALAGT